MPSFVLNLLDIEDRVLLEVLLGHNCLIPPLAGNRLLRPDLMKRQLIPRRLLADSEAEFGERGLIALRGVVLVVAQLLPAPVVLSTDALG